MWGEVVEVGGEGWGGKPRDRTKQCLWEDSCLALQAPVGSAFPPATPAVTSARLHAASVETRVEALQGKAWRCPSEPEWRRPCLGGIRLERRAKHAGPVARI